MTLSRVRAAGIVRLAARRTQDPGVRSWLRDDPDGTFLRMTHELYERAQGSPHFPRLTVEQVDSEIADMLRLQALTAAAKHFSKKV